MLADIRYAFRQLTAQPGFALTALLTLGLGIGTATTAFTLLHGVMFRPLPLVRDESSLVLASQVFETQPDTLLGFNAADLEHLNTHASSLEGIWGFGELTVIVNRDGTPLRLDGAQISTRAFALLGVNASLGRTLLPADGRPDAEKVALLSDQVWRQHFGSDPGVLETPVMINGQSTRVVGVMPPGWLYPGNTAIWLPFRLGADLEQMRSSYGMAAMARLAPGFTLDQAQAELDAQAVALAREHPATNTGIGIVLRPAREARIEESRQPALVTFWASCAIFLIACANVANLLLTRAIGRQREFALRLALGASAGRVIRQLLAESLVLGLLGGVLGLLVALWGVDLALAAIPVPIPFWLRFGFDPVIFLFVLGLSQLAGLLAGLAPALRIRQTQLSAVLQSEGRSQAGASSGAVRLRSLLVAGEIALALVLLVFAGLMVRSLWTLRSVDPGFDPAQVITFRVGVPSAMTDEEGRWTTLFTRLNDRLARIPGIEQVATTSILPGANQNDISTLVFAGRAEPTHLAASPSAQLRSISPNYFETLRIPLVAGRPFTQHDTSEAPRVAIVDRWFATQHFPEGDALGSRIRFGDSLKSGSNDSQWMEIVGIVGSTLHRLDRPSSHGTVYQPQTQQKDSFMSVVARVQGEPSAYVEQLREEVLREDPRLPIYWVAPMERVLSDTVWHRAYFAHVFTVAAAIALLLACIGIYGVMSYHVAQRTRELGMRLALGASPREVIAHVLRQGLILIAVGLVFGVLISFGTTRLISSLLFQVSPRDPPTFAGVPVLLAIVALAACYLPSRRVTRLDPMAALRRE